VENSFTQPNAAMNIQMLEWALDVTKGATGDLLEVGGYVVLRRRHRRFGDFGGQDAIEITRQRQREVIQMLEWALDVTKGATGDLLELYCGNGNFSLALARE
jgi:tRNA/tmRNA/rRNA uracil-C5-methylase (TrmA/RlmC/RlmD family)